MRTLRTVLPAGVALALAATLAGCGGDAPPAAQPSVAPTSIVQLDKQLDRHAARVVRVAFCDLLPRAAVRAALATKPERTLVWRNGDPAPDSGNQVGHEFGCAWFGPGSQAARAWVFAQPVRPAFAAVLVRQAARERGCSATPSAVFGHPSVIQTCRRHGGVTRLRRAALFGDTWLTCEVSAPGARKALRVRADAWCVRVADALDAG